MKFLPLSLVLGCSLALAKVPPAPYQAEPDESRLVEHGHYTNKKGDSLHSPAHSKDGKVPVGARARGLHVSTLQQTEIKLQALFSSNEDQRTGLLSLSLRDSKGKAGEQKGEQNGIFKSQT